MRRMLAMRKRGVRRRMRGGAARSKLQTIALKETH